MSKPNVGTSLLFCCDTLDVDLKPTARMAVYKSVSTVKDFRSGYGSICRGNIYNQEIIMMTILQIHGLHSSLTNCLRSFSHEELRWQDIQYGHCTAAKLATAPPPEPVVSVSLSITRRAPQGVNCCILVSNGAGGPSSGDVSIKLLLAPKPDEAYVSMLVIVQRDTVSPISMLPRYLGSTSFVLLNNSRDPCTTLRTSLSKSVLLMLHIRTVSWKEVKTNGWAIIQCLRI